MPSASNSVLANVMSGQFVAARAEAFQANGLLRSHQQQQQQQAITSSQTSLQKLPASSPQFLYHQQMQFPAPPPQQQQPQSMMPQNTLLVPQPTNGNSQLPIVNMQHLSMNGNNSTNIIQQPGANYSGAQPNVMMLTPMITPNNPSKNTQLQQQLIAQYPNQFSQQQSYIHQQQHQQLLSANNNTNNNQQQIQAPHHQQHQLNVQQQQQQQQVPMTTLMIPASAAAHLQNASWQIQQAAMQNNPNFQQTPQLLVFMIPYVFNNNLPPTIPPTPDQGPSSLNSTLVRQSNSSSSMMRQSHPLQPQQHSNNNRTVSSLSNQTNTTTATTKQEPEKFYIKVNFSYTARSRQELTFQRGGILHVLDTLQNNDYGVQYWLATKVKPNGEDAEKGLIPNKIKAEEIAIEQRTMDLSDTSKGTSTLDGSSGGVLSASVGRVSFLRRRAAHRSKSLCKDSWDNVVFDIGSSRLPTYERVVFKHPGFCRPVVIFGPLSDIAREKLLKDYPEKYSYPSGLSQSPDHPKVIRLKGVLDVIDQGKHALLDITAQAVEKLNHVNLAPIVIFMKTESKSMIKEFRARAAKSLDPNARDENTLRRDGKSSRKLLEQSMKMEKQWLHVFTSILDLSTMGSEMWYRKLRETIENQQSTNVWMSEKKSDKKLAAVSNQQHSIDATTTTANALANESHQVVYSMSNNDMNQHQQHSTSCMADSSSMLNERFSEALNISSTKSTNDLMPLQLMPPPEGLYGNRSQLRNAYAHSLAQKLARASSEPKLNGLMSDHDDDDDDDQDDDEEDDEDDDDDEIIKKPFGTEYDNSSSISSSNGNVGSSSFISAGPSNSVINHQQPKASSSSSGFNANIYQHYQYQAIQQQQQNQLPVKPPAPPPPQQQQQQQQQQLEQSDHQLLSSRKISQQQQESIYSVRNQLTNNSFTTNGIAHQQQNGTTGGSSNGSFINQHNHHHRDYHQLPPMTNNGVHQQQEANYHHLQSLLQTQATNGIPMSHNNNGKSATGDNDTTSNGTTTNNGMIDLARNHEARGGAYQVYGAMNHQNIGRTQFGYQT